MLHVSFLAPGDEQHVSISVHWHIKLLFYYDQSVELWIKALKLYYIIIGLWE